MSNFDIVTCANCGNDNRVLSNKIEVARCAICKERLVSGTLYDVLEIQQHATLQDIKEAYRRLAMKWHPDRNRDNIKVATAKFKRVSKAYEVLSNADRRAEYNDSLIKESTKESKNNTSSSNTSHQKTHNSEPAADMKTEEEATAKDSSSTTESQPSKPAQKWSKEINIKMTPFRIAYTVFLLGFITVFLIMLWSNKNEQVVVPESSSGDQKKVIEQTETISPATQASTGTTKTDIVEEKSQSDMLNNEPALSTQIEETIAVVEESAPMLAEEGPDVSKVNSNNTPPPAEPSVPKENSNDNSSSKISTFKIGSSTSNVKEAMGDPDGIQDYNSFVVWNYGVSMVTFGADEKVKGWTNISNGKAYMGNAKPGKTFTLESSEHAVIDALGTPDSVNDYNSFVVWNYEISTVTVGADGKVKGWANISNGKAYMGNAKAGAAEIEVGSTQQQVIDALGTPDSVNDYNSFIVWDYGFNTVTFDLNGNVKGYDIN